MRQWVEDAGAPMYAGWLAQCHRAARTVHGDRYVGGRRVKWRIIEPFLGVEHAGAAGAAVTYLVGLAFTGLPSGGARWWFRCPGCGRRVEALYLPAGRDRLGCRTCCGLLYRSQYTGRRCRKRRRPRVVVPMGVWLATGRDRGYDRS